MIMPSLRIVMICWLGMVLTACGGGGSGSGSQHTTTSGSTKVELTSNYGIFKGSTVVGVHYRAELNGQFKEGETDAEGKFQYLTDSGKISPVTFSVGGVVLGTVTPTVTEGSYTMNVFDLVDGKDPDAKNKALNIQRFLSSINSSAHPDFIQITSLVQSSLATRNIKLNETPSADFEKTGTDLLGGLINAKVLPASARLVAIDTVAAHAQETKNQIDAMRVGIIDVTVGADAVVADGKTQVLIRASAKNVNGTAMSGGLVRFQTTAGSFGNETGTCATEVTQSVEKMTDANGIAYVMLTPRCQTVNTVVGVSLGGKNFSKTIPFLPGPASSSQSTVTLNKETSQLTAIIKDAHGNPVADGMAVTLVTDNGKTVDIVNGVTGFGRTTFSVLNADSARSGTIYVGTDKQSLISFPVSNDTTPPIDAARIGSFTVTPGTDAVLADGQTQVLLRVQAKNVDGTPMKGGSVRFQTTAGSFGSETGLCAAQVTSMVEKMTDVTGMTYVMLTPRCQSTDAQVAVSIGGVIQLTTIKFKPGPAVAAKSSITVTPAILPADGSSKAKVTVVLKDINGNPVEDGTPVTLVSTLGSVVSDFATIVKSSTSSEAGTTFDTNATTNSTSITKEKSVTQTNGGRATYTLTSSTTAGMATLSLVEYGEDFLKANVSMNYAASVSTYGIFLPVVTGVHYRAELNGQVKEGETDAKGTFQYIADGITNSPVTFSVGGVILGTITPPLVSGPFTMSVFDLVDSKDLDAYVKAVNIQRFLLTINSADTFDIIQISSGIRNALAGVSKKLHEIPVAGFDAEINVLIGTLDSAKLLRSGVPRSNGQATLVANNDTVIDPLMSQIDATRVGTVEMTVGANSVLADGKSQVLIRVQAKNVNDKPLNGGLVHFQTTAGTLGSESNLCADTATVTPSVKKMTDATGTASVMLTPRCQSTDVVITVSLGGKNVSKTVRFTAGPAAAINSSITVNPAKLLADGSSKATVTVVLKDIHGNPVEDGTSLTLLTDMGTVLIGVSITNRAITYIGMATFTLLSANSTGIAKLYLLEYGEDFLKTTVPMSYAASDVSFGMFQPVVTGVHYRAELNSQVKEGETDAEGKFQFFMDGGTISPVTFSVGGVTLGTVTPFLVNGSYKINVYDFVDAKDPDAIAKAVNIQRFLNTINSSTDLKSMQVSPSVRTALAGETLALNSLPVSDFVVKANSLISTLISSGARPAGTVLVTADAVKTQMNEAKSQIDAMRVGTLDLAVGAASVLADGKTQVMIRVTAKNNDAKNTAMSGGLVRFQTTAGSFGSETGLCAADVSQSVEKMIDATGVVTVMLTSRCKSADAEITVFLGGKNVSKTVRFKAGPAAAAYSSITVNPESLPADGNSTATVTIVLKDANGNPVEEDTPVTFVTDKGRVGWVAVTQSGTNVGMSRSDVTTGGRITFTLIADSTAGVANISVSEYDFLKKTVSIGSVSSSTIFGIFQPIITGVHYQAELNGQTIKGETDTEGKFQFFMDGGTISPVTFSVGGVILGTITPLSVNGSYSINVYDLVDSKDPDAIAKAVNIQRFLSTINSSTDPKIMHVSTSVRTALAGETLALNSLPVADFVVKANSLISTLISSGARPAGTTLVSADAVKIQMNDDKSQIDAMRVGPIDVTVGADSVLADGKSQVLIRVQAKNVNDKPLNGALVHFQTTAGTLGSESNVCADTATVTASVKKMTDATGMASVMLTPRCQTANAVITVSLGGKNVSKTIRFTAGPAAATYSSITVNPESLPADGKSTATVTIVLKDVHGNPVEENTNVTFVTDKGRVGWVDVTQSGINVGMSRRDIATGGRITFTLIADSTAGVANISVSEYDFLKKTVNIGAFSSSFGIFQPIVTGIHYQAELNGKTVKGETDAKGKFQYISDGMINSPVTFSVGGVTLGTVTPPAAIGGGPFTISALDLVNSKDLDAYVKGINILRFLLTINAQDSFDIIKISSTLRESTVLAEVNKKLHEIQVADFDASINAVIASLDRANLLRTGVPRINGTATLVVNDDSVIDAMMSQIDAARVDTFDITVGADSVLADGKTQVLIRLQAKNVNGTALNGGLVHFQTTAGTLGSESNLCLTTTAVTTSVKKITDASGSAHVLLTPQCQTANAVVSISLGGKIVLKTVRFTPGPAVKENSSIVVNPKTLSADGKSTATVTVLLRDANNNPVADKTPVTLLTDVGSVVDSSSTTVSGRATFVFTAALINGDAHLTVSEYGFLAETISMGVVSSTGGKPNSIQIAAGQKQIFVGGVGKTENTGIAIQVKDDVGDPINETTLEYAHDFNNLRVTLKSHPQGGETIAGIGRKTNAVSATDVETKISTATVNSILVRSTNGSATITLTAGTRPGIVEFQVEALDKDGKVLAQAVSPLVTIASGPPHNITLSEANKDGIVNLKDFGKGGVYCRLGSALVTDRYGNAVPDGTTISLNLLDTVLARGTTGSITANDPNLTDQAAAFNTAEVSLSGVARKIQPGDQVLIEKSVTAQNRRRFVSSWPNTATSLPTNASYIDSANGLTYYVGASLFGGAIHGFSGIIGCDPSQLTTGMATTTGGIAPIRVTYPANTDTIQLGCLNYDRVTDLYPDIDRRFPNRSGQVLLVAAVNDVNDVSASGATVVTKGKFCYSAAAPAVITAFPGAMSQSGSFSILLKDDGAIPIPYVNVVCTSSKSNDISNALNISISSTNPIMTDAFGVATFTATITGGGGATPDTGTIACTGFGTATTISVTVP
ncbi:MAG: hypothetical protein H7839_05820 [Magnetococcus sp. YQC-5]